MSKWLFKKIELLVAGQFLSSSEQKILMFTDGIESKGRKGGEAKFTATGEKESNKYE